MKIKKRIAMLLMLCLTMVSVLSVPVMAAEYQTPVAEKAVVASVPADATYAGTIYRDGGSVSLGRITLVGDDRLYIYLPKNNNLDLFQGTVTFSSPYKTVTRGIGNYSTDTFCFTADEIGDGIWNVTVSGHAVGTTQRCQIWYKVE